MKTKNIYSKPLDKKDIQEIKYDSPAHRKYVGKNGIYDLTNAVDFLCKTGKPIKATLSGEVVHVKDGVIKLWSKFDEPDKNFMTEEEQDGNYVLIKHPNNELSIYSHLTPGKIKVKIGDKVKTGQIIGYTGHNGWSIKPHLHFMVFKFLKPQPAKDFESLKINWKA